jgi:hypothetical protein
VRQRTNIGHLHVPNLTPNVSVCVSVWSPSITLSVGHGARPLLIPYGPDSLGGTKPLEEGVLLRYQARTFMFTLVFLSIIPRGLSSFIVYASVVTHTLQGTGHCLLLQHKADLFQSSRTSGGLGYWIQLCYCCVAREHLSLHSHSMSLLSRGMWVVVDRACSVSQQQQVVVLALPLYFTYCSIAVRGSAPPCI